MSESPESDLAAQLGLSQFAQTLPQKSLLKRWPALMQQGVSRLLAHGDFQAWSSCIASLPRPEQEETELTTAAVTLHGQPDASFIEPLKALGPWKKGPFQIAGELIDAEWRSDLKWQRVRQIASSLKGRRVLDVGTGNGYFLYRAQGEGAHSVLGLEPTPHYCAQYLALQKLFSASRTALLPLTSEEFARDCAAFDTVLSMGVLYHRRSPLDHLMELRSFLRPGGELVLETIVVDGPAGYSLVPDGRYAQMRNVWFLPSIGTLEAWLKRLGMVEIRSSDAVATTSSEQRRTAWHEKPSLSDFLDPNDSSKTIEGHPAPLRAILTAKVPA